jgi:hypothetical protein
MWSFLQTVFIQVPYPPPSCCCLDLVQHPLQDHGASLQFIDKQSKQDILKKVYDDRIGAALKRAASMKEKEDMMDPMGATADGARVSARTPVPSSLTRRTHTPTLQPAPTAYLCF